MFNSNKCHATTVTLEFSQQNKSEGGIDLNYQTSEIK